MQITIVNGIFTVNEILINQKLIIYFLYYVHVELKWSLIMQQATIQEAYRMAHIVWSYQALGSF